jgi:hypothetical protein
MKPVLTGRTGSNLVQHAGMRTRLSYVTLAELFHCVKNASEHWRRSLGARGREPSENIRHGTTPPHTNLVNYAHK